MFSNRRQAMASLFRSWQTMTAGALFISVSLALVTPVAVAQDAAVEEGTTVTVLGESEMAVPAKFEKVTPKSRIIQNEFKASKGDATARLTMMAAGGDVAANVNRWKGQFSNQPDGSFKKESMEVGSFTVHLVDVLGTYAESMGGGPFAPGKKVMRENYAMAGAILEAKSGRKFFIKLIGPAEVVKANRDDMVKMIKSVK